MSLRALLACPHLQRELPRFASRFRDLGVEVETPEVDQQLNEQWLLDNIERFDGVVAGDDPFTAAVLARAKRLRVIAKWGIGVDNIDLDAAKAMGIRVINTPGQLSAEVAEVTIGYMVMLARHLHKIDAAVRAGDWAQIRGSTLAGKTLGVIGLGAIGRAVARRALGMEMQVLGYDPYADQSAIEALGVELVPLSRLLADADYISLNCNLTPENFHLIDAKALAAMKQGVFLINTSRGPLVDERALIQALASGRLAGVALDVFEEEPLSALSPLRRFENCIFGAHNCSNTQEAVARINEVVVANLLSVLVKEVAA